MKIMKDQILGIYTVRKSGNANSVTIPSGSGFKRGDNVILILKSNGDLEIKKSKPNFWDSLPKISEEEKKQEIEDLGYNPSEQTPVGKERIED